jgi:hypothetical protein
MNSGLLPHADADCKLARFPLIEIAGYCHICISALSLVRLFGYYFKYCISQIFGMKHKKCVTSD